MENKDIEIMQLKNKLADIKQGNERLMKRNRELKNSYDYVKLENTRLKNGINILSKQISQKPPEPHICNDNMCDHAYFYKTGYCRNEDKCLHGKCPLSEGEHCGNCD